MELQNKVVNAGFWSFLLHAGGRLIGFARTLVIARLLAPDDIGLFAIVSITLVLLETVSNPGIQSALIQKKGDITDDLNVTWTVSACLGLLKTVLLFFLAPAAAAFFKLPEVIPFIRTVAVALLISGFMNTGVILLRKELDFKKHFAFMLSGIIADLVVAVAAAFYLKNAWALVYGLLARHTVHTIFSFLIHPFRPRFQIDFSVFRKLFGFGVWVNLTGLMGFLANDGARVVIGKFVDTYALGLYQIAFWITESALVEVVGVFSAVAFSAYSKMQNNPAALRRAFIRTAGFKVSVVLPVTVGIILAGDLFVNLFLGAKWADSIPVLMLLALSGCFLAIARTGNPVFLALGKPRLLFFVNAIRAAILLCLVIPFTLAEGIEGAAAATIVSNLGVLAISLILVKKELAFTRSEFYHLFAPELIATFVMGVGILILKYIAKYIFPLPDAMLFVLILLLATLVYLFTMKKLEQRFPANQPLQALGMFAGNRLKSITRIIKT